MDDIEILEKLDKGQIDFNEAFTLMKKNREAVNTAKGHFLKINIKDGERCFPIVIPLFLIKSGFSLGKAIVRLIPKDKQNDNLEKVYKILEKIESRDIKRLVDALRRCRSYPLVRVENGDTLVDISVI
ncbi:hypothetical protein KVG29_00505 [Caldicoprobacter algeriensis]|uniref:hypothetical protein n=1 Tax=Caldicoprobacter algeriensis TaxID=699281 RepID=UPI00207AC391|nr:hypothetical protein [Caldicoprobacter algeriensis]MCM8899704.1 hypothetical protein [Caldicoprobacter algeriensis]